MESRPKISQRNRDTVLVGMRELARDSLGKAVMRHAVEEAEVKIKRRVNLEKIMEIGNAELLNTIALDVVERAERRGIRAGVALREELRLSIPAGLFLEKKEAVINEAITECVQAPRISRGLKECLEELTYGDTEAKMTRLMDEFDASRRARNKKIVEVAEERDVSVDTYYAEFVLDQVSSGIRLLAERMEKKGRGVRGISVYRATLNILETADGARLFMPPDSFGRGCGDATFWFLDRNARLGIDSAVEEKRKSKEVAAIYILIAQALIDYREGKERSTDILR